ncbi:hypothetical protein ATO11_13935 [Pseudaestuariivita atlantica]|uniref:HTH araC/xylS-type domain-containing protein n=1 Tax=Pseudaestuariivita atlantica TaxID=1317121 RepID=A0A0L1JN26_9RHOB|nr:hypothetical protein ATO11_13935 [Pseudaestuariivita atlantica]
MSGRQEVSATSLTALGKGETWRLALPHYHDNPMLIWLTRGEGRIMMGGRHSGLAPGMLAALPARALIALTLSPRAHGCALSLSDPDSLQETCLFRPTGDADEAMLTNLSNAFLQSDGDFLAEGASRALAALRANEAATPTAADRLLGAFFGRVVAPSPARSSMAEHAAALGVTPTHLTRVCRTALGRSAADVLTGRVLHASRTALQDTDAAIKDIAEEIGFSSAAYFTRFIQKHTGQTPSVVRRKARMAA